MTGVEQLDLSFNNLEGDIPDLKELDMEKMYLTSNSLNGSIPTWINSGDTAQYLFRSYAAASNSELGKCLSWFPVERDSGGAAKFVPTRDFWGTSSTENALGSNHRLSNYVATNVSAPTIDDSKLYTTARLFPLSITYYVRCLPNGNYTVTLHFAEIVFRDNVFSESWNTFVLCIYPDMNHPISDKRIKTIVIVSVAGTVCLILIILGVERMAFYMRERMRWERGHDNSSLVLDWPTRQNIYVGVVRGLTFLHEESILRMVHRDIKAANVLLDRKLTPTIADFG
uniref:non-specific serine/threonine protein kinase n=1 Tax=Lactuca sativa TaxID=4236 RepID=A0A9R1XSB5_LACSA|nr:hypothetical protein LSAT_V11C200054880 [Lactuca sativa]